MAAGQLSNEAKSKLAPNAAAEDKLAQITSRMGSGERRAFWLGVLLLDGAVTLDDVLRAGQPEMPAPRPALTLVPEREPKACVCGAPRAARAPGARGPHPSTCEQESCPAGRRALIQRAHYVRRHQPPAESESGGYPPENGEALIR
jgi:hypothetical protein